MTNLMKLVAENYGKKVQVEISQDSDIYEVLEAMRVLVIGLTYVDISWRNAIIELADIYRDEDTRKFPNGDV